MAVELTLVNHVAVSCCSVLQCVAVCCSLVAKNGYRTYSCESCCSVVLQCVAVWWRKMATELTLGNGDHSVFKRAFTLSCCSVVHFGALWRTVHCVALWRTVVLCVAMCFSVLQCCAVCCSECCSELTFGNMYWSLSEGAVDIFVSQCVAVCCSVLQCVACSVLTFGNFLQSLFEGAMYILCCSVLQCVAVCCSAVSV